MQTLPVRSTKSCDIYPLILKLSIKHNQSVFSFQKTSLNPPTEILVRTKHTEFIFVLHKTFKR